MNENNHDLDKIEKHLTGAAPPLPPGLKARTLAHCAQRVERRRRKSVLIRFRWAWSIATVCLVQWCAVSLLDHQSTLLLDAASPAPHTSSQSTLRLTSVLNARAQLLDGLMANRDFALPESG